MELGEKDLNPLDSQLMDRENRRTDDVVQHNGFRWKSIFHVSEIVRNIFKENRRTDDVVQHNGFRWKSISHVSERVRNIFKENRRTNDVVQHNGFRWKSISHVSERVRNIFKKNRRTDDGGQQNESWNAFMSYVSGSIRKLSPKEYGFYLVLFGGVLSYLTRTSSTQFDSFQAEKTTPDSVLTLGGVFGAFFPELVHITSYIIVWIITFILVLPLELAPQISFGLFWICSTVIYLAELVQKTSACGHSFKLPMFWLMVILAFGFSFIIGFMLFLSVYLTWRFIHKGSPRSVEVKLSGAMSLVSYIP